MAILNVTFNTTISALNPQPADVIYVFGGTKVDPVVLTIDQDFECTTLVIGNSAASYTSNAYYGKMIINAVTPGQMRRIKYTNIYIHSRGVVEDLNTEGLIIIEDSPGVYSLPNDETRAVWVETAVGSDVYEKFVYYGDDGDPVDEGAYTISGIKACMLNPVPVRKPLAPMTAGIAKDFAKHTVECGNDGISRTIGNYVSYSLPASETKGTTAINNGDYGIYAPNIQPDVGCYEMGMGSQRGFIDGSTEFNLPDQWSMDYEGNLYVDRDYLQFTLTASILIDATSLQVDEDISSLPAEGWINIGDELIRYMAKDDGTKTLSQLVRGEHVTDAAAHTLGDDVNEGGFVYVIEAENKWWWRDVTGGTGNFKVRFDQTDLLETKGEGNWTYGHKVETGRKIKVPCVQWLPKSAGSFYAAGGGNFEWNEWTPLNSLTYSTYCYFYSYQYVNASYPQDSDRFFNHCAFSYMRVGGGGDLTSTTNINLSKMQKFTDCLCFGHYQAHLNAQGHGAWIEDCQATSNNSQSYPPWGPSWQRYSGTIKGVNQSLIYDSQNFMREIEIDIGTEFHTIRCTTPVYMGYRSGTGDNYENIADISNLTVYHSQMAATTHYFLSPCKMPDIWDSSEYCTLFLEVDGWDIGFTPGEVNLFYASRATLYLTQDQSYGSAVYAGATTQGAGRKVCWSSTRPLILQGHSSGTTMNQDRMYVSLGKSRAADYVSCKWDFPYIYGTGTPNGIKTSYSGVSLLSPAYSEYDMGASTYLTYPPFSWPKDMLPDIYINGGSYGVEFDSNAIHIFDKTANIYFHGLTSEGNHPILNLFQTVGEGMMFDPDGLDLSNVTNSGRIDTSLASIKLDADLENQVLRRDSSAATRRVIEAGERGFPVIEMSETDPNLTFELPVLPGDFTFEFDIYAPGRPATTYPYSIWLVGAGINTEITHHGETVTAGNVIHFSFTETVTVPHNAYIWIQLTEGRTMHVDNISFFGSAVPPNNHGIFNPATLSLTPFVRVNNLASGIAGSGGAAVVFGYNW